MTRSPTEEALDDPMVRAALALSVARAALGGIVLRSAPGPARDGWLELLRTLAPPESSFRKIPLGVSADRLIGGVDLSRTLRSGRRVARTGLLAESDGGLLLMPSAERIPPEVLAPLLEMLDRGRVTVERDGISERWPSRCALVAMDESLEDEPGPADALSDRLALRLSIPDRWTGPPTEVTHELAERARNGRRLFPDVEPDPEHLPILARRASEPWTGSLRPLVLALGTARALAAGTGRRRTNEEDLWWATTLVLVPRGAPLPAPPAEQESSAAPGSGESEGESDPREKGSKAAPSDPLPPSTPAGSRTDDPSASGPDAEASMAPDHPAEVLRAVLPPGLDRPGASPARLGSTGGSGHGSGMVASGDRGRCVGSERGLPGRSRRLDLSATLRAAAPWQAVRAAALPERGPARRISVVPHDLHVQRRVQPVSRRTIFLVDASGSQALRRLGEVKGAVELLLADSYRDREEVALAVFRDRSARRLVPPTRSLTRVKRLLRGLPGGGGTPLARALALGLRMSEEARRDRIEPRIVLLTDGRPNVDAAGRGGRTRAKADALTVAGVLRERRLDVRVLDTSPRPERFLDDLARVLGTRSHHLPFADSRRIRRALESDSASDPAPRSTRQGVRHE